MVKTRARELKGVVSLNPTRMIMKPGSEQARRAVTTQQSKPKRKTK